MIIIGSATISTANEMGNGPMGIDSLSVLLSS